MDGIDEAGDPHKEGDDTGDAGKQEAGHTDTATVAVRFWTTNGLVL